MRRLIMKTLLKAIYADIYIRLSSKSQEDGMSKETQERECRKYCEENGIIVRNVYYENKSAMTPYNRPVFYEMVAKQQSKDRADIIVSFCINRLTRNQVDFYPIRALVDEYNTKIIFVKERMVIEKPFKAHEKFLTSIIIASAEFEVNHLNEIRKNGLIARAKTGQRPSKLPYGYDTYKNRIVIVPKEAELVKKAFELYATGKYSLKTLADELFELGYRYKGQRNKKIPRSTLSPMLKNLFYTGYYTYPNVEKPIKGKYKPIISKDLYDKVQEILKTSGYEKLRKHNFLYSNLITLQETGKIMTGEIKKNKYIYYTAFDDDGIRHSINETVITEAVLNYFKEIRLNLIPKEIVNEVLKEELKPLKQKYANLKRDVSRKYHSELRLNDFIQSKNIDDKDFINDSQADIEKAYSSLPERIAYTEQKLKTLTSKCQDLMEKRLYDVFIQLGIENQRKIIELVKNRLELQEKKVKLTFKPAFRKIRNR